MSARRDRYTRKRCTRKRYTCGRNRERNGSDQSSVMTDAFRTVPQAQAQMMTQVQAHAQAQAKTGRRRVFRTCRFSN